MNLSSRILLPIKRLSLDSILELFGVQETRLDVSNSEGVVTFDIRLLRGAMIEVAKPCMLLNLPADLFLPGGGMVEVSGAE